MKKIWVAVLMIASGLAQAQVTPELAAKYLSEQADLETFASVVEEELAIMRLLRSAPAKDPMSIVPSLAKRWGSSESAAAKTFESVVLARSGPTHAFQAGLEQTRARIVTLIREAMAEAPDSRVIWALGLERIGNEDHCDDDKLRDAYMSRPFAEDGYPRTRHCRGWRIEHARRFPDSLPARLKLVSLLDSVDAAGALAASRWALDAIESREVPADVARAARRRLWSQLADQGLGAELLADAAASAAGPPKDAAKPREEDVYLDGIVLDGFYPVRHATAARSGWMFALLEAQRGDEARAAFDAKLDGDGVLKDVLFGNPGADLFARYLEDPEKGLLWKQMDSRLAERAAARFLEANQLPSAARYLESRACAPDYHDPMRERYMTELAALPAEFRAHRERYARLLAANPAAAHCPRPTPDERPSSRLPRLAELTLTAEELAQPVLPDLDMKIPLPASFELVRAERRGDDVLALCDSPAVDPAGEVGAGGYWLLRSRDGGKNWSVPHYLGLQVRSPYVAKHEARISMFTGDALRIEADVAELDPDSITFPPVMLRNRREVPDIRIDIPFADIERDTDGDGWTDLLEAKLHTDPAKADTDGDGLGDALDDFPHASARGTPDPDAALIVDLLKRIMGFERAGIIEPVGSKSIEQQLTGMRRASAGSVLFQIIVGDPARFAGLRADSQVIVISEAQLLEIRETSGPFYPLQFPDILFDAKRERAVVRWSAGWVGGTLLYRKVNGRWKGEEVSSWITQVRPAPNTSPG